MKGDLIAIYNRDTDRLITELASFETDDALWFKTGTVTNSAGNLFLHLCGNLRHFIGHILGKSGYQRNRELEFSQTGLSRDQIRHVLHDTKKEVMQALEQLDPSILPTTYPLDLGGQTFTVQGMLIHLAGHLTYHLGQINYLRRVQTTPVH